MEPNVVFSYFIVSATYAPSPDVLEWHEAVLVESIIFLCHLNSICRQAITILFIHSVKTGGGYTQFTYTSKFSHSASTTSAILPLRAWSVVWATQINSIQGLISMHTGCDCKENSDDWRWSWGAERIVQCSYQNDFLWRFCSWNRISLRQLPHTPTLCLQSLNVEPYTNLPPTICNLLINPLTTNDYNTDSTQHIWIAFNSVSFWGLGPAGQLTGNSFRK